MIKNELQLEKMRICGESLGSIRDDLEKRIKVGMRTDELDLIFRYYLKELGLNAAFKDYRGFPKSICVSINSEAVHGIPNERVIIDGDLVKLDLGARYKGYYSDTAVTVGVGNISDEAKKLMRVTGEALYKGIEAAQPGAWTTAIGAAIENHVIASGFSVPRNLSGHGIGTSLHEPPRIWNYEAGPDAIQLVPGMVIAIEPVVNAGGAGVGLEGNRITYITLDGSLSAHFEHTVEITEDGPKILTLGA